MKVKVCNLGPIKEAEIELKPLTVLIGPNNAGKTWLAYTLASILGSYGWRKYLQAYINDGIQEKFPVLENLVQDLIDNGNTKIDLIQFAQDEMENYFGHLSDHLPAWLQDFIGTNRVEFSSTKATIYFEEIRESCQAQLKRRSVSERLSVGRTSKPLLTALKQTKDANLYFYSGEDIAKKLPLPVVKEFVFGTIFSEMQQAFYWDAQFFPVERTAFIALPFFKEKRSPIVVTDNDEEGLSSLQSRPQSIPLRHFLGMMLDLHLESGSIASREKAARKNKAINQYMQLTRLLENKLLDGTLDYSTPEPQSGRELLFIPYDLSEQNIALEVSAASSMVKELSPLVLYLRYLARPGELLVIDEPEMNLHPEAQVKLVEFLAMLVNAGLHVLVNTHSTYIVDHLINLMEASKRKDKAEVAEKFYLEDEKAFITQDKVAAYLIDNGTAENILDEDGYIHWGTFSDVTRRVGRIYLSL